MLQKVQRLAGGHLLSFYDNNRGAAMNRNVLSAVIMFGIFNVAASQRSQAEIASLYVGTHLSTSTCAGCPFNLAQDYDDDGTLRLADSRSIQSDSVSGSGEVPAEAHAQASVDFDIFGGGIISANGRARGNAFWNGVRVDLPDYYDPNFYYLTTSAEAVQESVFNFGFTLTTPYAYSLSSSANANISPLGPTSADASVELSGASGLIAGGTGSHTDSGILEPGAYSLYAHTSGGVAFANNDVFGVTDASGSYDSDWHLYLELTPVPIPAAIVLLFSGLAGFAPFARRRTPINQKR